VLDRDLTNNEAFVTCGQIADRIYGAISLFGFPEFTDYFKKMKELSYKCSYLPVENEKCRKTCLDLISNFADNCDRLIDELTKQSEGKSSDAQVASCINKIKDVLDSCLSEIEHGSVAIYDIDIYFD
jgi:hypothetical protein